MKLHIERQMFQYGLEADSISTINIAELLAGRFLPDCTFHSTCTVRLHKDVHRRTSFGSPTGRGNSVDEIFRAGSFDIKCTSGVFYRALNVYDLWAVLVSWFGCFTIHSIVVCTSVSYIFHWDSVLCNISAWLVSLPGHYRTVCIIPAAFRHILLNCTFQ